MPKLNDRSSTRPSKSGTTFRKPASNPLRDTNPVPPSPYTDPCYRSWSLVPRTGQSRSLLGYTFNCAYALHRERAMWQPSSTVMLLSINTSGAGPGDAAPERKHIPLPPHDLWSTGIRAKSIVYPLNGRSVDVVGIYTVFA